MMSVGTSIEVNKSHSTITIVRFQVAITIEFIVIKEQGDMGDTSSEQVM